MVPPHVGSLLYFQSFHEANIWNASVSHAQMVGPNPTLKWAQEAEEVLLWGLIRGSPP